jgi:DNA polymerase/3'-5' exonuclease PolX
MSNAILINELSRLVEFYSAKIQPGDQKSPYIYKVRTFTNLISQIAAAPFEITDATQLSGIKGIGPGSLTRVNEILKTGKLAELPDVVPAPPLVESHPITDVHGVGPVMAQKLLVKYNITTAEEFMNAFAAGTISKHDITRQVEIGLKYFYDINKRIDHDEITSFATFLKTLCAVPFMICGSYRRETKTSGDVDLLAWWSDETDGTLLTLTDKLRELGVIVDTLAEGETKFMGIAHWIHNDTVTIFHRLDIRRVTPEQSPFAILYYTGSDSFNKRMREHVTHMGLLLNEYGLFDKDHNLIEFDPPIKTERDIFSAVNFEYVKPCDR